MANLGSGVNSNILSHQVVIHCFSFLFIRDFQVCIISNAKQQNNKKTMMEAVHAVNTPLS